jgi:hypothetical protein
MSVFARNRDARASHAVWFGSILLVAACSSKGGIDFFEPSGDDDIAVTGGTGATGGTPSGGSAGDGVSGMGGTSGDSSGGTGADPSGGTAGDAGGSSAQGGTDAGTGGMPMTGGTGAMGGSGGSGGSGESGTSGTSGSGTGGTGGAGMGGGGTGGAGSGGTGGVGGTAGVAGAGGCVPSVPASERCDGVDNNCMGGVDEGSICPAFCTGATRGGHTYLLCSFEAASSGTRLRSWTQAQEFCTTRTHGLLFVETAEENAFIRDWIAKLMLEDQVWMGANDRDSGLSSNEGEWVWGVANNAPQFWDGDESGDPIMSRYNDWADGEPNNGGNEDCGVFASNHDYHWDDRDCTDSYANFVCESLGAVTTQ